MVKKTHGATTHLQLVANGINLLAHAPSEVSHLFDNRFGSLNPVTACMGQDTFGHPPTRSEQELESGGELNITACTCMSDSHPKSRHTPIPHDSL